jgi:hypothetical protein
VNVSATITDNYDVPTAYLAIKRPDNSSENVTMLISGPSYSYNQSYGQVGIYEFTIWASDTSGNWNLATGDINITDSTPPSADAGQDRTIPQGTTIVLDGSNSWDNYLIANYSWSFFDVVPVMLYGDQPLYTFNNIGNYEITLTVVDSTGNSDMDTVWVNATDAEKPEVSGLVIDPIAQEVFGNVNISASIVDNYDVPTASIAIKFPDSTEINTSMLNIGGTYYLDQSYNALGVFGFTIWANDSSGNFDFATGFFVIIDTTDPIADGGADIAISIGSTVTFDGSGSSDNLGISNYTWSFFDSEYVKLFGISPSYTFANAGDFLIILKVEDASGNSDIDTLWVNVTSPVQATGVIKGLVVDENGNPITGATIRLLLSGTVLNSTTTNSSGRYMFSGLGFGAYSIEVSGRNQTVAHDDLVLSSINPTFNLITTLGPEKINGPPPKEVIPLWVLVLIGILAFVIIILTFLLLRKGKEPGEVERGENLDDSIMVEGEEAGAEKIED